MLSTKGVPFSVRVSHEDAEFIAALPVNGAKTPSDKLRAIISQARIQHQGGQEYGSALSFFEDQIAPVLRLIRNAENDCHKHSELLGLVNAKVPELLAFIVSSVANKDELDLESLQGLEKGVAIRLLRLSEAVMRLAVTRNNPCYDEDLISDRIDPMIDLAQIILASRQKNREGQA